jgi:hypothetical protein
MIYFIALIPATGLTIAGYFVLYLAHRSEGAFRAFGKYLGFWAFTLAALVLLGAVFAAAHGGPMMRRGGMQHWPMHGQWQGERRDFGPAGEGFRGAGGPREAEPGATQPAVGGPPPPPAAR